MRGIKRENMRGGRNRGVGGGREGTLREVDLIELFRYS